MSGRYCTCTEDKRDWRGVAGVLVAPPSPEMRPWVEIARQYVGLVLCEVCGGVAPWRGEPVGQVGIIGAAAILRARMNPRTDAPEAARCEP